MAAELLADQLTERLGRLIIDGDLPPGTVVRLEDVEKEHGVSRTVAREAVKALSNHGLLDVRRRVGSTVAPQAEWNPYASCVVRWRLAGPGRLQQINEIAELRSAMEPTAARLAADRATPAERMRLTEAADAMSHAASLPDLETFLEHDIVFHTTILSASHNPLFAALSPVVAEVLSGRTRHHLMPPIPNPRAVTWHHDVAHAVRIGRGKQAERAMRLIVNEAQQGAEEMAADQPATPAAEATTER